MFKVRSAFFLVQLEDYFRKLKNPELKVCVVDFVIMHFFILSNLLFIYFLCIFIDTWLQQYSCRPISYVLYISLYIWLIFSPSFYSRKIATAFSAS